MSAPLERLVDALAAQDLCQYNQRVHAVTVRDEIAENVDRMQRVIDREKASIRAAASNPAERVVGMMRFARDYVQRLYAENRPMVFVYLALWVNAPEIVDPRAVVPAPAEPTGWMGRIKTREADPVWFRGEDEWWRCALEVFRENGGEVSLSQFLTEWEYFVMWGQTKRQAHSRR